VTAWERKAPDHYIVSGDTNRQITDQLLDGNGVPVDLSSGSPTVRYILYAPGAAAAKVQAAATIVTPATGIVRYTYQSTDIDTPGVYLEEWQVTTGTSIISYPEVTAHKVLIRTQVGS